MVFRLKDRMVIRYGVVKPLPVSFKRWKLLLVESMLDVGDALSSVAGRSWLLRSCKSLYDRCFEHLSPHVGSFHSFEKGTKEWSVRTLSIGVFLWFKTKHMGSKIQISGTRVRRKHITRSSSWFPQLSTDESAEFRCTDTPCVGFPKNRSFPTHVLNDPRFSLINTWIELEWIHAYCNGLDILPLGHLEFDRSILPNISFLNWQALEMILLWKTHLSRNHRINVRKADVDNVGIEIHLRWSRI